MKTMENRLSEMAEANEALSQIVTRMQERSFAEEKAKLRALSRTPWLHIDIPPND